MKRLSMKVRHACLLTLSCAVLSTTAHADIVQLDDLITEGSHCVGLDCSNGENFGFDTIRLKENNVRINFQDTSNTASFPSTDWRIVINDSGNGGANYFGVEDSTVGRIPFRVEGGAPANTLYVEDDGDVGIKTANPVVDLHVVEGNTPTLRLEQDGSDGFTPQTWDIAGNEANFFIRDVINSSNLPFRILPGSGNNNGLIIAGNGDVGLGTAAPARDIHITDQSTAAGTDPGIRIQDDDESWDVYVQTDSSRFNVRNNTTNNVPFKIDESADNTLMLLGTNLDSSRVEITGKLFLNGLEVTPDYVFEPSYDLETIEEHADFMWNKKHLPAVKPATVNENGHTVIQVGARTQGMLEELEKAHIYIHQLNGVISQLKADKQQLSEDLLSLENDLNERLSKLEKSSH